MQDDVRFFFLFFLLLRASNLVQITLVLSPNVFFVSWGTSQSAKWRGGPRFANARWCWIPPVWRCSASSTDQINFPSFVLFLQFLCCSAQTKSPAFWTNPILLWRIKKYRILAILPLKRFFLIWIYLRFWAKIFWRLHDKNWR